MIAYLDTSAVVPIVIDEPTTAECRRVWNESEHRVSSRLTYVETAAALAMARRQRRISVDEQLAAWSGFVKIWPDVDVVDVTEELTVMAAQVADRASLRAGCRGDRYESRGLTNGRCHVPFGRR